MKKILFILPIVALLAAGCNSSSQTNFSKLEEFKQSAPFPVLVPSYIPEAQHYQVSIPTNRPKDYPAFILSSQDSSKTQIVIYQHLINRQFLIDHNDWDPATGWPRSNGPKLGELPIQIGNNTGYLGASEDIYLKFKQGDLIIEAHLTSSVLSGLYGKNNQSSLESLALNSLVKDLVAIVGSMK